MDQLTYIFPLAPTSSLQSLCLNAAWPERDGCLVNAMTGVLILSCNASSYSIFPASDIREEAIVKVFCSCCEEGTGGIYSPSASPAKKKEIVPAVICASSQDLWGDVLFPGKDDLAAPVVSKISLLQTEW